MTQTKAFPDGMHSITPHLVCAGATSRRRRSARPCASARERRHSGAAMKYLCLVHLDERRMNELLRETVQAGLQPRADKTQRSE